MVSKDKKMKDPKKWHDQYNRTLWFQILFDHKRLGLEKDFLEHKREGKVYREYVTERLLSAAISMQSTPGELIALTQLLHTASCIVLLESKRDSVDATLNFIKSKDPFTKMDPTVVVTSVALYFLVRSVEHVYANDENNIKKIKHMHNRLDQLNWLVGIDGMNKLNLLTLDQCFHDLSIE